MLVFSNFNIWLFIALMSQPVLYYAKAAMVFVRSLIHFLANKSLASQNQAFSVDLSLRAGSEYTYENSSSSRLEVLSERDVVTNFVAS